MKSYNARPNPSGTPGPPPWLTDTDERPVLSAARSLTEAGFATHWLKPNSKAPAAAKWSEAPVATFEDLKSTCRAGANIGLRLGEPSLTEAGYVHLFDVDIRIAEFADEAWTALRDLLPGIDLGDLPTVISGSGGESRHVYFVSDRPFFGKLLAVSEGKHRRKRLDEKTGQQKDVWSNDWEIELYGTGKQVVLPPSIHPDTGKPYRWDREFDLDMLSMGIGPSIPSATIEALGAATYTTYEFESREPLDFKPGQLERELDELAISDFHYDDWIRLGQALHHQFGGADEGWSLWLKHTRRSKKYDGDDRTMRKKWQSFGRYRGKPVTMGTVRHWVQEARSAQLIESLDDLFDDEGDDLDLDDLLGDGGSSESPVPNVDFGERLPATVALGAGGIQNALVYDSEWKSYLALNDKGEIISNLHNVRQIIRNDPRLRGVIGYNMHKMRSVIRRPPHEYVLRKPGPKPLVKLEGWIWDVPDEINGRVDSDDGAHRNAVRAIIEAPRRQGGYGLKVSDRDMKAAWSLTAHENAFHPVRGYLNSLCWDGSPRIERLFIDYLGTPDDSYHRATAMMTLLGAVARVFNPGCKFDYVPVIEGRQGVRKSTFVKTLAVQECWFGELEGDFHDTKAMVELMEGSWILELPELQGFSKAEITTVKAFVTRTTDKCRRAFGESVGEFARQSIIIGTTNDKEYLRDTTGGRRFWPIECRVDEIDIERLRTEVHQVWAEAKHLYDQMVASGRGLYIEDPAAKKEALRLQESRRVETPEEALAGQIQQWLDTPIAADFDDLDEEGPLVRQETCIAEIWEDMLGNDTGKLDHRNSQMIGRAMQMLSEEWYQVGRKRTKRFGQQRVYRRTRLSSKDDRGYL